ncbi:hypothetical protein BGZ58_002348, partial [Dissophora ornata]
YIKEMPYCFSIYFTNYHFFLAIIQDEKHQRQDQKPDPIPSSGSRLLGQCISSNW